MMPASVIDALTSHGRDEECDACDASGPKPSAQSPPLDPSGQQSDPLMSTVQGARRPTEVINPLFFSKTPSI